MRSLSFQLEFNGLGQLSYWIILVELALELGVFAVRFWTIFNIFAVRCGSVKTITALHLIFMVTCTVQCGTVWFRV